MKYVCRRLCSCMILIIIVWYIWDIMKTGLQIKCRVANVIGVMWQKIDFIIQLNKNKLGDCKSLK